MKKRNIAIVVLFAAIIVAILFIPKPAKFGAGSGSPRASPVTAAQGQPTQGARQGKTAQSAVFSVRTATAIRMTIQDYIEVNGDIVVDRAVDVYPYVSGRLVSLRATLGTKVEKGQLIAEVDPTTPGSAYALNEVFAPISGTVTSLPISIGSKVGTASAIAKIGVLDASGLQISAKISERYIGALKIGLKATISLEAYQGEAFAATVSMLSPVVDAASRTKEIRLSFDESDPRINAGMFAKIKLNTIAYPNRIAVSEGAIVGDYDSGYIFVALPDATVSKRAVERGVSVDGIVEIRSGLKEGEAVVVEGASVLSDGARIKVVAGKSSNP